MMTGMLKTYKTILYKHPYVVQTIQTSMLMGTGDALAQTIVEKKKYAEYDLIRTAQFAGIGMFVSGPVLTVWYRILDRLIQGEGKIVAVKKVFVDQCLFAPISIFCLITIIETVQGNEIRESVNRLKHDYCDIMLSNYCVWPWIQMANFSFVPLNYQVLVIQICNLFWNTYLSWKVNKKME